MALVGDVIVAARTLLADVPQTLAAPTNAMTYTAPVTAGATLPAATYFLRHSLTTNWGETLVTTGAEQTQAIVAGQGLQVALPAGYSFPVAAASMRVYFGLSSGTYYQYVDIPTTNAFPYVITSFAAAVGSSGPVINRAYLPDTDGSFIGISALYGWLNEALDRASDSSGGIRDYSGIQTTQGQPLYVLTGKWIKIMNLFFDGYEVAPTGQSNVFYRNATSGYVGVQLTVTLAPQTMIECFPQPNRTGGSFTTTGALSATGTSVGFTGSNFVLPFGLALVGGTEIVSYQSLSGNVMSGLVRGMGGTQPTAFASGTTITELNVRILGQRRATTYTVGSANTLMRVPPGWETLLPIYIQSRYYDTERDYKASAEKRQQFEMAMKTMQAASHQLSGPVQINPDRGYNETYGGGLGGGWLIR